MFESLNFFGPKKSYVPGTLFFNMWYKVKVKANVKANRIIKDNQLAVIYYVSAHYLCIWSWSKANYESKQKLNENLQ